MFNRKKKTQSINKEKLEELSSKDVTADKITKTLLPTTTKYPEPKTVDSNDLGFFNNNVVEIDKAGKNIIMEFSKENVIKAVELLFKNDQLADHDLGFMLGEKKVNKGK